MEIKPKKHKTGKYQTYQTCNKCGGDNKIDPVDSIESYICEAETECTECGFKDYWAYGFFESLQDGYNSASRYK